MCGIAGIFCNQPAPLDEAGASLLRLLQHRGPDDQGWLLWQPEGVQRGRGRLSASPARGLLVHRRLSILDLSRAGWQPMATPDDRYFIVFNGEIYNYLELRRELEMLGHAFCSNSDTEVLLHGYAEWGEGVLMRLVGMFAFAVLDTQQRTVFLARDFFGIKPLYYVHTPQGFAFASEIKALLSLPGVRRHVHPHRLYEYLRLGRSDHGGETLFRQIRQLPAAHFLKMDLDDLTVVEPVRYWQIDPQRTFDISAEEAALHLRHLFLENVRFHLRSDVPVGAALSGGIDSSAIVAAMRHLEPRLDLHAFSYVADDAALSEERWVDTAGGAASAAVHKTHPAPEEVVADLEQLIRMQDEPFGSTSIYAQHRVFRLARAAGVTVMLDGQGADEMLGGYRSYLSARLASLVRQGRWHTARRFLRRAARQPGSGGWRQVVAQTGGLLFPALKNWARSLAGKEMMPRWLNGGWFARHGVLPPRPEHSWTPQVLRQQLHDSLMASSLPMLLRYEDRNSMAHSIESRVPFLTPKLVEFLLALPEEYLIDRRGTSKSIFRRAMRGLVPDAILDRRDKIGFATPEQRWLTQLRPWVEQTLSSDAALRIPALNQKHLFQEWQHVLAGRRPFDFRVWRWVNLIRWVDVYDVRFDA